MSIRCGPTKVGWDSFFVPKCKTTSLGRFLWVGSRNYREFFSWWRYLREMGKYVFERRTIKIIHGSSLAPFFTSFHGRGQLEKKDL